MRKMPLISLFFVYLQPNFYDMKKMVFLALTVLFFYGCSGTGNENVTSNVNATDSSDSSALSVASDSKSEAAMRALGLVDIHDYDSTMAVQMVYATPYNFMGRVLYHDVRKAFMLPELAEKVVAANRELKKIRPDANLIIYDAARPLAIQQEMWDMVKGTEMDYYVSNPEKRNGLHNYGAAVDVTIMDCTGHPLPMGSEYDYFGVEANTDQEETLLRNGRITIREYENRLLLRRVMTDQGLLTIKSEWWHFNLVTADVAREKYKIIE